MNRRLEIIYGTPAFAFLQDNEFIKKWLNLYDKCSFATVFQNPGFACSWYEIYASEWQPLIIANWDLDGNLVALWLLAYSPTTNMIDHAGTFQAEYHTWLALPDESIGFLANAWLKLSSMFQFTALRFIYLPNISLLQFFERTDLMHHITWRKKNRPLIKLDSTHVKKLFSKKSNISTFNSLKKLGTVTFARIRHEAELEQIIPKMIEFYDLRQAATHQSLPFQSDDKKLSFLTRLFNTSPDKIYIAATYLNNIPIAITVGMITNKTYHLSIITHSPFVAKYSPGKLHLMQLNESLLLDGYDYADFTPGDDVWKDRLANVHDEVAVVTLFKSAYLSVASSIYSKLKQFAKSHIKPLNNIKVGLKKLSRLSLSKVFYKIKNWFKEDSEIRVYRLERSSSNNFDLDEQIKCNSIIDLLSAAPCDLGRNQYEFLSVVLKRLESEDDVYTITINNCLAFYSWMNLNKTHSFFTDVKQAFNFPEGSAVMFDAYTNPKFRRRGLYQIAIAHMIHRAFTNNKVSYFYGCSLATNFPSCHTFEKMGFQYQGSCFLQRRFGFEKKWIDMPLN